VTFSEMKIEPDDRGGSLPDPPGRGTETSARPDAVPARSMSTEPLAERDIAVRLAAGDPAAIADAFARWADLVHGVARQMVGTNEADDVTQQVYLEAWRTHSRFDPERGEVPGWLVGITRNLAKRALTQRRPAALTIVDDLDTGTMEPAQERVIDALLVAATLRDLPDEQREVLELTLLEDLTQAECAHHLNVPIGTIKSRQRRGLRRLRQTHADAS
jgi:RNA polymerase sigma factor (sigma-70 family)